MEQERGVLVSAAEVRVVEGELVTATRQRASRGWGSKAIACPALPRDYKL